MRRSTTAYLQWTVAMATVGSAVIASKVIGASIDPYVATALRFALAFPVLLAITFATRARFPRVDVRDAILLVAQATVGSVGFTILLVQGLKLTSSTDGSIILGTLPAATALTAVILLGERLNLRTAFAIAMSTVGVLLIVSAQRGSAAQTSLTGDLLVMGAVVCECLFILLNKRLSAPWPPLPLATAMSGIGLLVSTVAAMPLASSGMSTIPTTSLLAVIYYAMVPTVLGFYLWYAGAEKVAGAQAAVFTAIAPVSGVLLSCIVLGEALNSARIGGLAAVVGAVLVNSVRTGSRGRSNNCSAETAAPQMSVGQTSTALTSGGA